MNTRFRGLYASGAILRCRWREACPKLLPMLWHLAAASAAWAASAGQVGSVVQDRSAVRGGLHFGGAGTEMRAGGITKTTTPNPPQLTLAPRVGLSDSKPRNTLSDNPSSRPAVQPVSCANATPGSREGFAPIDARRCLEPAQPPEPPARCPAATAPFQQNTTACAASWLTISRPAAPSRSHPIATARRTRSRRRRGCARRRGSMAARSRRGAHRAAPSRRICTARPSPRSMQSRPGCRAA
jgi:hypothetical protein